MVEEELSGLAELVAFDVEFVEKFGVKVDVLDQS